MTKPLKSLLGIALTLAVLTVVPLHKHASGDTPNSGDCQICAVAGQALVPDAGDGAPVISVLFFAAAPSEAVLVSFKKDNPQLRGPPLL